MSDPAMELRKFARTNTWLESIVEGKHHIDDGVVENISTNGLYICLRNHPSMAREERVTIEIYDLKSSDEIIVSFQDRVVRVDSRGVGLHLLPTKLSDHLKFKTIVELVSQRTNTEKMQGISVFLMKKIRSSLGKK